MYPASEIFRRPGRFIFALFLAAVTASSASAQCYEFSGSGATLQIDITSFTSKNGPTFSSSGGYITSDYYESNNTFTLGGVTQTSQSTANTPTCVLCLIGSVLFDYGPGPGSVTAFTMTVPSNDTPFTTDSWIVVLGGMGDVIPSGVLPSPADFPTILQWVLPVNENNINVNTGPMGTVTTSYPITSIGPCSNTSSGGGNPTGAGPTITGVKSASDFGGFSAAAPGSWIEIYGTDLAPETGGWSGSDFVNGVAPTMLDGVSVSIDGQAAFVDYISAKQVNVQLPSSIPTGGPLQLTVSNGALSSLPYTLTVNATEPGLLASGSFKIGANQYVVAQHSDGTYVLPVGAIAGVTSRPAKPGETILIYGVGFGSVTPPTPAGKIAAGDTQLVQSLDIFFGQTAAQLTYYGLAPTFVGLYQFDVVVPTVANNNLEPLTFTLGGTPGAQTLYTAVQQ
jgi:uncharacterized protein (TIGR03437 family)